MVGSQINNLHTLILNSKPIQYQIRRKNISSLRLALNHHGQLTVSAPRLIPDFVVHQFVVKNSAWISKHLAKQTRYPDLALLTTVTVLGQPQANFSHTRSDFTKFYKKLALTLITDYLEQLCLKFGFSYNRLSLRNQSTRFGSCSSRNNLNFNWQCIFFPKDKFQHLLLHELVHTQIKNHSSSFWNKLRSVDPNTQSNRRWLKKFGSQCFLIPPGK